MPEDTLIRSLLLPELSLIEARPIWRKRTLELHVLKQPMVEYCPHCASASRSAYDHRSVRLKDEPLRGFQIRLVIRKRRSQMTRAESGASYFEGDFNRPKSFLTSAGILPRPVI